MAASYETAAAGAIVAISTAGPIAAVRAGANEIRLRELQLTIISGLAVGEPLSLFRTTAVGTATTSKLGLAVDPDDPASLANLDSAWSVNPSIPTDSIRRVEFDTHNAQVAWWHWHEQDGLVIPANGSVVIWRTATPANTGPSTVVTASWEE